MESERSALQRLKDRVADESYSLAFNEEQCATLYALAFNADNVQMVNHLKYAKRALRQYATNVNVSLLVSDPRPFRKFPRTKCVCV